jgi:hypothetical protein
MAKFMKGIAVFLLTAGIIAAIVIGTTLPSLFSALGTSGRGSFNFAAFLTGVLSSVVMFALFFSAGYVIELLESIDARVAQMLHGRPAIPQSASNASIASNNTLRIQPIVAQENRVVCKKCGALNPRSRATCQKCGTAL